MQFPLIPEHKRPSPAVPRKDLAFALLSLGTLLAVIAASLLQSAQAIFDGAPIQQAIPVVEAPIATLAKQIGEGLTLWMPLELRIATPLGDVPLQQTLAYAIYEWIKLPAILYLTTFGMAALRLSISTDRLERTLGRGDAVGVLAGIVLGVFTPVCSCTVANLYAGLLAGGAHRRSAAAFLFASPAMNGFAVVFMLLAAGPLGLVLYMLSGAIAAFVLAYLSDHFGLKPRPGILMPACDSLPHPHFSNVLVRAQKEAVVLTRRLLFAVLLSGALAAVLINFNLTLVTALQKAGHAWWGPIVATLLGLPLDINAASTAPILFALREVVPLGTLISAMMATAVASIPEGSTLVRLVGARPTLALAGFYGTYVALVGLLVNALFA
ncbi:MAG: permease [Thermoflexales bacterium]|nr:permease [Thermoflexales bacterium]